MSHISALLALTGLPRRLSEIGLLFGAAGALLIAIGAYAFLQRPQGEQGRRRERMRTSIGALLLALAFLLQLVGLVTAPKAPPSPTPASPAASSSP